MAISVAGRGVALPGRRPSCRAGFSGLSHPIVAAQRRRSTWPAAPMASQAGPGPAAAFAATAAASASPEPQKGVWTVGGHPTEVLELPAAGQPECTVLVVPGNPGAASYYTPFMRSLHSRLGGRAAVLAVSNLGMDSQGLVRPGSLYSLEDQVAHKTALLRERLAGPGRPPLVLLGHSIGAYMCIHATHRTERQYEASSRAAAAAVDAVARREWEHPAADSAVADSPQSAERELRAARREQQAAAEPAGPAAATEGGSSDDGGSSSSSGVSSSAEPPGSGIVKVVGLFPFLTVDPDCSHQRSLRRLTRHHGALARLAGCLGWLPLGARRALVRWASPNLEPHAVDVSAQIFTSRACAENGLFMGLTEFEALAAPPDWWLLRQLGPRAAVVAAPNDVWFKTWKFDALHREVPGIQSLYLEGQSHAFCVSHQQSDELAGQLVPLIQAAVAGAGSATPAAAAAAAGSRL